MNYLKKEYQNATVAVKIKNRTVTVDTSLLSEEEKKRLSKNESFKFLFNVEPIVPAELTELIEPIQEPEVFPEFSKTKMRDMTIGELKTVYPFVMESSKKKIIDEIIEFNYGNPESEDDEEEQLGVL